MAKVSLTAAPICKGGQAFTLVELLLAVFLLCLLLGALVFSFSTLQPDAKLFEGADRFETLLRYAKAHAAYSGCRVQIQFQPDPSPTLGPTLHRLRLVWEPDPWEQPGTFQTLSQTAWDLLEINRLIAVEKIIRPLAHPDSAPLDESNLEANASEEIPVDEETAFLPPIDFFPDGSSESATILLASRSEDETRKIKIQLTGLTGMIRREVVSEVIEAPAGMEDPSPNSESTREVLN